MARRPSTKPTRERPRPEPERRIRRDGVSASASASGSASATRGAGLILQATLLALAVTAGPAARAQAGAEAPPAAGQAAAGLYAVPAGPLADALLAFAASAGVTLQLDAQRVEGRRSEGLSGRYGVGEGFARLLAGSGLEALERSPGVWVLRPALLAAPEADTRPGPGESTLPAVTVKAAPTQETATGPVPGVVARRSLSATKTDVPIVEAPQSISVVTRDQMDAQNVQSVSDALRYTAGVLAEANGPDPRADNIVVRGFDTGGRDAFRDGLRAYAFNNQGGTIFEPYGLERVEVLRGPSSVLYGQGGPGGMVNLVSKRPTAEPVRELQVQLGNRGRRQLAGDAGGKLSEDGRWTYRLVGLARESRSFIDHVDDDRGYLAAALGWNPGADTSLTLLGEVQRNRRGQGYQALPRVGTLDPNPNGRIPSRRFLGQPGFDKFDQDRAALGYLLEHRVGPQLVLRQNARYQRMRSDVNTVYMTGLQEDGRTVGRFGSRGNEKVLNAVIDNQLQLDWQHGRVRHTTLLGLDVQRMRNDSRAAYGAFGDLDVFAPQYGPDDAVLTLGADNRQRLTQTGLYLQDQLHIDDAWVATLGLRRDRTRQSTDDRLDASHASQKDGKTTSRLGLVYLMPAGWAPYLSYSESFTPVVDRAFDGSAFKPEQGRQYELGLRYQPAESDLSLTASLYHLTRRNVTTADLEHVGFSTQRGEVRSRGVELEAKANLDPGWELIASYAHGQVKLTRDNDGNQGHDLSNLPRSTAAAWVQHSRRDGALAGLALGLGVRHLGSTYRNDENTGKIPAYTLVDLSLRYQLAQLSPGLRGWDAALNVSNLFDREYVATCGYYGDGCKYGYRRNLVLTARYGW